MWDAVCELMWKWTQEGKVCLSEEEPAHHVSLRIPKRSLFHPFKTTGSCFCPFFGLWQNCGFFFFLFIYLAIQGQLNIAKGCSTRRKIPPVLRTIQLLRQYVWKDFLDEFQHHFTWNWEALYLIDCIYTNFGDATKYYTQMPWMWLSWNTIVSGLV